MMTGALVYLVVTFFTPQLPVCGQNRNRAPKFENDWFWEIEENAPIGSRPRFKTLTNDPVVLDAYDRRGRAFTFDVIGDKDRNYFTVDPYKGIVKLRKSFDRELISSYTSRFIVSNGLDSSFGEANVTIIDVNDNPPLFDRIRYEVTIRENSPINSEVLRLSASDPDSDENGEIVFRIIEKDFDLPFRIQSDTGVVRLSADVDYESISKYRFVVEARDRNIDRPLSSTAIVTVNIADVQDTPPVFDRESFDTKIDENTPARTVVATVSAQDGDKGQPNEIAYTLVKGKEYGIFSLDTSNGKISFFGTLDRERPGFNGIYFLTVRATERQNDRNIGGAYSETSFQIEVNDMNDNRPQFAQNFYQFSVSENTPVGTRLPISIYISDADQDFNSDVTMTVGWNHSQLISITPVTFRRSANVSLILIKNLDFETEQAHQFQLFANETSNPSLFTACNIQINVGNENDNEPVFTRAHYYVNVSENAPLNQSIFQVRAEDSDDGVYGMITYSVVDGNDEIHVNQDTGAVFLLKALNYEESRGKQYVIKARDSSPLPLEVTALLSILVLDENDNPPVFSYGFSNLSVFENSRVERLTIVKATDADSFPNNILTFFIMEGLYSDHFSILTSQDGKAGVINVIEPFDYDSMTSAVVELSIKVEDQGHLFSVAFLVVDIVDANDIAPVFENISNITIKENIGGGILVGRIGAKDGDSNKNGRVFYYVTGGEDLFHSVFHLNEVTGDITTNPGTSPDYEVIPFFDIIVTAQDGGIPPLKDSQSLRISVQDMNDNPPIFEKSVYAVNVDENFMRDLLTVHATDADAGRNSALHYSIFDSDATGVFHIDETSGLISAIKQLDFEELGEEITFQVMAEDMGSDVQLHALATVLVSINDVNDNTPVFRQVIFPTLQVKENELSPFLGVFQADDSDSGMNSKLTYSIIKGNDLGHFDFSPQDGELRIAHGVTLDRENVDSYTLILGVSDAGEIPRSSTMTVWIEVLDANDNAPRILDVPPYLHVTENSVNVSIFQLKAFDPDIGSNGLITFSFADDENPQEAFFLNPATGVIDLVIPLDREEQDKYNLSVVAEDNPENQKDSKFSTATIQIIVNDVNDEKPEFMSSIPYRAIIDEELPPGTFVTYASVPPVAIDRDLGENSRVTYFVIGSGSSYFSVDAQTGTIYSRTKIDREDLSSEIIDVVLRASDVDGQFSETIVKVTVNDINDNNPRFDSLQESPVHVLENISPGHVITRMNASDLDLGVNGQVLFHIQNGSFDKFRINARTGLITLAPGKYLDRESQSMYHLSVVASDQGIPKIKSSTAQLIVMIGDVNDSRPKFTTNYQNVSIHENSAVGSTVATLSATDDDLRSVLSYHMTSVTIYGPEKHPLVVDESPESVLETDQRFILKWFHLDAITGKISLSSSSAQARTTLDREVASSIRFTFIVRDDASDSDEISTSLHSMTLQVNIVDQNDNSPRFEILTKHVTLGNNGVMVDVMEECAIGTILLTVLGRDKDQGNNGQVVFELVENMNGLLRLETQNPGTIVAARRIDRESLAPIGGCGWINVTLLARDLGSSTQRLSKLKLRMRVKDVNDNSPMFLQQSYKQSLLENVEVGAVAIRVTATDKDIGDFGNITYRLDDPQRIFTIDRYTGEIKIAKSLDRESNTQHKLVVTAEDSIQTRSDYKDTQVQVTINVLDVNDNSPEFVSPLQTTFSIMENIAPGTTITTVKATDLDLGEYGQVTYSCQSNADYLTIDRYSGDVSVLRPVTASRRHPAAVLNITATDGGGLKTTLQLQFEVEDVNDHFPAIFHPTINIFRIPEEEPAGLLVTQLNATDDDLGLNGVIRYRLAETNDAFCVDDVNGRLLTSRKLDREANPSYRLALEAFDLGSPSLISSKFIMTVHLDDINDNKPIFPPTDAKGGAFQSIDVYENHVPGTVVGEVINAMDRDEHPKIFYHVISENGDRNQRTFDMERSKIILRKEIDREKLHRYKLIIQATNSKKFPQITTRNRHSRWKNPLQEWKGYSSVSTPKLFFTPNPATNPSLLQLTIKVLDVIDEPPQFLRHQHVIPVEDGTTSFMQLAQIKASDKDIDDIITYTILQSTYVRSDNTSSEETDFVIHSMSGVLSSATTIRGPGSYYILTVEAKDRNNLFDKANVTVMVMRGSQKFKFVVDCPPDVVREQQENLTMFLKNLTNSFVVIDDVSAHSTSAKEIDVTRSDVIIRAFDSALGKDEILQKLASGGSKLNGMFSSSFFRNLPDDDRLRRNSGETALRVAVVILSLTLILLILIFTIFIIYMRRRHRNALTKLQPAELPEDVTITSKSDVWDQQNRMKKQETCQAATTQHKKGVYVQDCSPAAASSLLWTPTAPRRGATANPAEGDQETMVDNRDSYNYNITLHSTGPTEGKPLTPLHGSDSAASF